MRIHLLAHTLQALKGRPLNVVWNLTLVGNIISAWVPYGSMEEIAAVPGVKSVTMKPSMSPPWQSAMRVPSPPLTPAPA